MRADFESAHELAPCFTQAQGLVPLMGGAKVIAKAVLEHGIVSMLMVGKVNC